MTPSRKYTPVVTSDTSRVRMYLAWLADRPDTVGGDPLTGVRARDWAARDYRV
jgi:hypothetical protein